MAARSPLFFFIMNLSCLSPILIKNPHFFYRRDGTIYDESEFAYISVPCGKCPACLMRKKNEWTNRLLLESSISYNNLFFTLTYDELHEPFIEHEQFGFVPVHRYEDVQLFLKRLRKLLYGSQRGDLRFFIASEYTPNNFRSHYHGLFFNYPINRNPQTDLLEAWQQGIECPISTLSDGGASYCCKYLFKQQKYLLGQPQNFMRCSQKPPIGFGALSQRQIQYLKENETDLFNSFKTGAISLPRTFKNKIFDSEELSKISEKKINEYTDKVEAEILRMARRYGDERAALRQIAIFKRQLWTELNRKMFRSYYKLNKLQ